MIDWIIWSINEFGAFWFRMHQIRFAPGLRLGPRWGSSWRSPGPLDGWGGGTPSPYLSPRRLRRLDLGPDQNAPNSFCAGLLGELMTLPRPPSRMGRGTPLPIPLPPSTPSASRSRRLWRLGLPLRIQMTSLFSFTYIKHRRVRGSMLVLEVIGHGDERSSYATAGMTRPGRPGASTNSLHWGL